MLIIVFMLLPLLYTHTVSAGNEVRFPSNIGIMTANSQLKLLNNLHGANMDATKNYSDTIFAHRWLWFLSSCDMSEKPTVLILTQCEREQ